MGLRGAVDSGDPSRWQPTLAAVGQLFLELTTDEPKRELIASEITRLDTVKPTLGDYIHTIRVMEKDIVLQPGKDSGITVLN
jgi:hypothetical protein